MDIKHIELLEFLHSEKTIEILAPEYLFETLEQDFPSCRIIPYCAADEFGSQSGSVAVLHKGLLHKLQLGIVTQIAMLFEPIFANPVFVVLRKAFGGPTRRLSPEMMLHFGPISEYCRASLRLPRAELGRPAAVISAWGVGNVGDDAVSVAAQAICHLAGFSPVTMLGPNSDFNTIDSCELVVVGGGGLIYDVDMENVGNYTAPLHYASDRGILCAVLGVGTQGIQSKIGRIAYHSSLIRAQVVTVRDEQDMRTLSLECGIPDVQNTADLAFSLVKSMPHLMPSRSGGKGRLLEGQKLAVVSLSLLLDKTLGEGFARTYILDLIGELQSQGYIICLAQHSVDDAELYSEIISEIPVMRVDLAALGLRSAFELYSLADIAITSRFHGVVFASITGTKVAVMCSASGKTGRMISSDLQSLQAASSFPPAQAEAPRPSKFIAKAKVADKLEVDKQVAQSWMNLSILRDMYESKKSDGLVPLALEEKSVQKVSLNTISDIKNQEEALQVNTDDIRISYNSLPENIEGKLDEALIEAVLIIVKKMESHSTGILEVFPQDQLFENFVKDKFDNIARFYKVSSIEQINDIAVPSGENIGLIKTSRFNLLEFKKLVRKFKKSTILVAEWRGEIVEEDELRATSVELGLQDISIFRIDSSGLEPIPIFSLGKYEGPILFVRH